jgi:methanogenic corrinoid protein MtbC1
MNGMIEIKADFEKLSQISERSVSAFKHSLPRLVFLVNEKFAVEYKFCCEKPLSDYIGFLKDMHRNFGDTLLAIYEFSLYQTLIQEFSWFASVLHYRGFEREYFDKMLDTWIMAIHGTIEHSLSRELVFPLRILQKNLSEFLKRSEITSEPENNAQREFIDLLLEKRRRNATDFMMGLLEKGNQPGEVCSGVLMPGLRHIGILWQKNKISAADEHAATEICRYIIFRLCDSIPREKTLPYQALVSCVPGEEHEMGAEIMASYLESKGWRVYFVGHSAPEQDNIDAITKNKPDVVFLSVTLISNLPETVEFLKKIRKIPLKTKIVLGGKAAISAKETVRKFTDAIIDDYQEVHSKALELLGKNA